MTKLYTKRIDSVMSEFGFERVMKTMKKLDWRWGIEGTVPSMVDLMEVSRDLLHSAIESSTHNKCLMNVSSGGFIATAKVGKKSGVLKYLKLSFVVSEWEWFEDDNQ